MNFLEAVQTLAEGGCEGIQLPSGLFTLRLKGGILMDENGVNFYPYYQTIASADWQLVGEKPQTETREVKRWVVIDKTGAQATYYERSHAEENAPNSVVVELTGTYTIEFKQKVKRREQLENIAYGNGMHIHIPHDSKIPVGAKFYAEYESEE